MAEDIANRNRQDSLNKMPNDPERGMAIQRIPDSNEASPKDKYF